MKHKIYTLATQIYDWNIPIISFLADKVRDWSYMSKYMNKIGTMKKHYPVKNALGGSFCKKCHDWSNLPDGLKGYECLSTKEEIKRNRKL